MRLATNPGPGLEQQVRAKCGVRESRDAVGLLIPDRYGRIRIQPLRTETKMPGRDPFPPYFPTECNVKPLTF